MEGRVKFKLLIYISTSTQTNFNAFSTNLEIRAEQDLPGSEEGRQGKVGEGDKGEI
jgi:hypothetical protein